MLRSVIAAVAAGLCCSPALAEDLLLSQLYGSGVHQYFQGDTSAARKSFDQAIDMGSTDPRCFYFQGLALLRDGRENEAAESFSKGADLESRQTDRIYSVSKSLERVQGPMRLTLERYRVEARRAAQMERDAERKRRYRRMVEQMPKPAPAARGTDVIPPEVKPEDMPAEDTARSRAPAGAPPAPAPVPPAPTPGAEPASDGEQPDPFAEPGDAPTDEAPAEEMPPEEAPSEGAGEEAPMETPPAEGGSEDADPFGEPGAA